MQPELLTVVERTTQYLKNYPHNGGLPPLMSATGDGNGSPSGNGDQCNGIKDHPLLNLIDLVYKQMKMIAESHTMALKNYQSILKRYGLGPDAVEPYTVIDYWAQAQMVLQVMLADYLNIQSVSADDHLKANFPEQSVNISSFFSRRKPQT